MGEVRIITNHVPRDIVEAHELPATLRKSEFDYLAWDKIEQGEDSASFIRYKGEWYDLGDFQPASHGEWFDPFPGWDGYISDTFFSGILVKYVPDTDFEQVIMGRYYS
jgi:hypothetical protein